MGMYLIDKGTRVMVEKVGARGRVSHVLKRSLCYWKEEVKWTSKWRMCFQHKERTAGDDGCFPNWKVIVPTKNVKYG